MERYNRHIILPNFGEEGQQKLKNTTVLIIGMGGLGSIVSQYLCAAGIGRMGIVDADTVSLTNLQRQILYRESDLGKPKVICAENSLKKLNSNVIIDSYNCFFDFDNALKIVDEYDLIIDCCDNFATRYLINDVCVYTNKPFFYTSILEYEAQISVFNTSKDSATYRCLYPDYDSLINMKNPLGVLGTTAGLAACLEANEVIKYITKCGEVLIDKLLVVDLANLNFQTLNITSSKEGRISSISRFKNLKP